jgi:hypothetical protein
MTAQKLGLPEQPRTGGPTNRSQGDGSARRSDQPSKKGGTQSLA